MTTPPPMDKYPPGFRFYPTEEELISFYLLKKLQGERLQLNSVIPVVAVYEHEPWQLPELSGELCHGDTEQWFFFVRRPEREALGRRPTRTTGSGYWKTTGSPTYVYSNNKVIGVKKTMVFYNGKAPCGKKTKWKMNEYQAIAEELPMQSTTLSTPKLRREVSLCRLYVVSGSMRAFDRRPLVITSNETVAHQANNVNGVLTSSQNTTMVDKTSSQSSCTFKDPLENTAGNTICDSINDNESLWEWEQFDWL